MFLENKTRKRKDVRYHSVTHISYKGNTCDQMEKGSSLESSLLEKVKVHPQRGDEL